MKIQRTIPPAAAPVKFLDLLFGFIGLFYGKQFLINFECQIKKYFSVKHVYLVSSGKAALTVILEALSKDNLRNEVIIPAYTCYSVPSAIVKAGLRVVPCDLKEGTLDYDYELLEKSISDNTLCVISSNLFGIPSDIDTLINITRKYHINLVEDAAQAMGVQHAEKYIGTIGDVGFFSLGRGKNITCNSGGIIVTSSEKISESINEIIPKIEKTSVINDLKEYITTLIMYFFINPSLFWFPSNLAWLKLGKTIFYKEFDIYKLSGMKAGLMRNWIRRLEDSNALRLKVVRKYNIQKSIDYPCIRYPVLLQDVEAVNRLYGISLENGLGISKMYPDSINHIDELKHCFKNREYPVASSVAKRLITLPTHHLLRANDILKIKSNVQDVMKE